MAEKNLVKTADGAPRYDESEDFNDDGTAKRPLHLKRGDPRAVAIEGKPKFRRMATATLETAKKAK